jgi:prepilin-type processing-associated H-X9-DG protein
MVAATTWALSTLRPAQVAARLSPFATTNYCGVLGPHDLGNASLWGGEPDCHNFSIYGHAACQGTFWRHSFLSPVSIASFRDGASNTIIVGECLPEYDDFKYWAITNGTWASTHAPINWIPDPNNSWSGWYNQMGFRSRHAGGATFAFGDGHISFVSETIDQDIYRGMSTRAGGEVISTAGS